MLCMVRHGLSPLTWHGVALDVEQDLAAVRQLEALHLAVWSAVATERKKAEKPSGSAFTREFPGFGEYLSVRCAAKRGDVSRNVDEGMKRTLEAVAAGQEKCRTITDANRP